MTLIRRANTIYEDGTTDNGYFIQEWVAGSILGIFISSLLCLIFASALWASICDKNYIIPKASAKGLYLQLEDGKLYKKQ